MAAVQRRVLFLLGVMVLGVVIVALMSWPALVKQYHRYRLRTEPGYLVAVLNSERARVQEKALRSFSRTPAGQAELFQLCVDGVLTTPRLELVDEALETYIESGPGALALQHAFVEGGFARASKCWHARVPEDLIDPGRDRVDFSFTLRGGVFDGVHYTLGHYGWNIVAKSGGSGGNEASIPENLDVKLLSIFDLLKRLQPGQVTLADYPHLDCEIRRRGDYYVSFHVVPRSPPKAIPEVE